MKCVLLFHLADLSSKGEEWGGKREKERESETEREREGGIWRERKLPGRMSESCCLHRSLSASLNINGCMLEVHGGVCVPLYFVQECVETCVWLFLFHCYCCLMFFWTAVGGRTNVKKHFINVIINIFYWPGSLSLPLRAGYVHSTCWKYVSSPKTPSSKRCYELTVL